MHQKSSRLLCCWQQSPLNSMRFSNSFINLPIEQTIKIVVIFRRGIIAVHDVLHPLSSSGVRKGYKLVTVYLPDFINCVTNNYVVLLLLIEHVPGMVICEI